jgi:hypothetical protein
MLASRSDMSETNLQKSIQLLYILSVNAALADGT